MPATVEWFKEFEFDLPAALLNDLVALFARMSQAPLDSPHVKKIPEEQGVYQLFLNDQLAYIGKTDSEAGLNKRLARHTQKIWHRTGLAPGQVSFKAVRIFVFTAVDLEQQLIRHYEKIEGIKLAWNNSGFGANDPGRERDTSKLKENHFDLVYPIDIDATLVKFPIKGEFSIAEVLSTLKAAVPYTLRFQNAGGSKKPHPDLVSTKVTISSGKLDTRRILRLVQIALGSTWQVTKLPGYVIVYKESKLYPHSMPL